MQYETIFIVTPVLTEEQLKETVKKYSDFLKKNKAEIVHEESWGLRKLAYPIRKKNNGYYHLIEFQADTTLVQKLEVTYKRDEHILRFLTVKLDKHGIDYNEKRRKGLSDKKGTKKEIEKEKV